MASGGKSMLHIVHTTKSLDDIDKGINESAARHKFGVVAVHNLRESMAKKGVEFSKDVKVYEVCNPVQAKRVLEANGAVSTALPCRISVYEAAEGGYNLATLLPSGLMQMFDAPELAPVAEEVEVVIKAMMAETATA